MSATTFLVVGPLARSDVSAATAFPQADALTITVRDGHWHQQPDHSGDQQHRTPPNKTNRRTVMLELLFHSTTTSADIPALSDAKLTNRIRTDHGEAWSPEPPGRSAHDCGHGSRASMKTAAPGLKTMSRGGGKDA